MRCESKCVPEESGSFSGESCSLACNGYVLAGEPSANKVGSSHKSDSISELNGAPHIVMLRHGRPVLVQYLSAMLVYLDLGNALMACQFKPEVEPADACK
jgi:hypothetical protein